MIGITAVLCTARREPQFTWMADSFTRAINYVASVPVELIVVDKLLWEGQLAADRRMALADAVRGRFSYRHLPPKPCAWQGPYRKTRRDWYALNNARNTGIALARFPHIVLLDDCSVLDEQWLEAHVTYGAQRGAAVAGSFRSYTTAEVRDGQVRAGTLHSSGTDYRGDETIVQCAPGWMYGLNCSFPLKYAVRVNGYDEFYDGQGGSEDCDFGVRLSRAGCPIYYVPDTKIYQILTTHEPVCETGSWDQAHPVKQKERLLRDGKMHFANELLIQELIDNPTQEAARGNDFDMRALRARGLTMGAFPTARSIESDWRDNQPLSEM